MKNGCWYILWLTGSALFVVFAYWCRRECSGGRRGGKEDISFIVSLWAICYAAYILVSLLITDTLCKTEAAIHLVVWTLGPPLWFMFDRYVLFGPNHTEAELETLKEQQDYAAKIWAALLVVMLAFQLGENLKLESTPAPDATKAECAK